MPLSENPPQQPTSLVLHFTDLTPQAIAVLQALGFGGAGVGKPVTGAGANKVLFTDDSGNLSVTNKFSYQESQLSSAKLTLQKANPDTVFAPAFSLKAAANEPDVSQLIRFENPNNGSSVDFILDTNSSNRNLWIKARTFQFDSNVTSSFIFFNLGFSSNNNPRIDVISDNALAKLLQLKQAANHTADAIAVLDNSDNPMFRVLPSGGIAQNKTITPNGTTGNQTINKPLGTVNIAAGQSSVTVTNSLVDANSIVFAVVRTNDTTAQIKNVTCAAGSFTIRLASNATAETSIGFMVMN
jgi:hypothetical protein